ncbi:FeoA family protein [Kordiimonas sp. SCSIO 12610]|uniref:FeoA family protein n=1 Tax=Kordiimonas sp. SCSIO 12610 TaxID=2829597 RepID=UPI00210AA02A|nr:FeoA family protein [Kordiimonas sp. SCSIO 12610]UTW54940.1 ferrous iron transport protein A [Kordiimonas sp. SCSIO 12610]
MKQTNTGIPLGTLSPGAIGVITQIGGFSNTEDASQADRLREIGFAEDLPFEILQQSPFGRDPIAVSIDGMTVAIRRNDANIILVDLS